MKKIESLPPHNFLLLFSLLKKNKTKFTSLEVKTHILQKKCATSPPHMCMYRHSLRIFFRKAIFICIFQIQIKYFFYNLKVSFRCELISFFLRVLPNLGQYYVLLLRLCLHQIHIFQSIHMNTFHNTTKSITTWRFFFGKKHPHTMMIFLCIFLFAVYFIMYRVSERERSFFRVKFKICQFAIMS